MAEGASRPPDATPPQRKLFPGAQSEIHRTLSQDVDQKGSQLLARERALPELMLGLQALTGEYYNEFVKVSDDLPAHARRVWPGGKPGHFYNEWTDNASIGNSSWDNFIFKSHLFFDKESPILARPDLRSYEAQIWETASKDEKKPKGKISVEFGKRDNITSITLEGLLKQFTQLAAKNSGFNPSREWGYDLFFGQFMHKKFMFNEGSKLQIILSPEPKILLYNTDVHKQTHFSYYSFDKKSEEPVFRGNLPTTAKKTLTGGAFHQDTLTPAQFKDVVQGALMVLPRKG